jgi:hypothetical protein
MKPNSLPCRAGPVVPPTGHSTKRPPLARTTFASVTGISGRTVLISMNSLPVASLASSPFSPL